MKSRITLAVAALAAALVVGCNKAPQFTADDETAVRALFDGAAKDLKAGNFEAWAATFTDDALLQPPNGKSATGRAGLVAWGKSLPPLESVTFTNVKVAGDGIMAYGSSEYTNKMTGMHADTGKQLVVFKKGEDKKWMTVAVSFSSDIPLPPPPVAKPAGKPTGKAPAKAAAKTKTPVKPPAKKGGHPK